MLVDAVIPAIEDFRVFLKPYFCALVGKRLGFQQKTLARPGSHQAPPEPQAERRSRSATAAQLAVSGMFSTTISSWAC
jgi:hypothetical protein